MSFFFLFLIERNIRCQMYALFFLTSVTYYDFYANPAKNRQSASHVLRQFQMCLLRLKMQIRWDNQKKTRRGKGEGSAGSGGGGTFGTVEDVRVQVCLCFEPVA